MSRPFLREGGAAACPRVGVGHQTLRRSFGPIFAVLAPGGRLRRCCAGGALHQQSGGRLQRRRTMHAQGESPPRMGWRCLPRAIVRCYERSAEPRPRTSPSSSPVYFVASCTYHKEKSNQELKSGLKDLYINSAM